MADRSKRDLSPPGAGGELVSKRARVDALEEETGRALVPAGAPQSSEGTKRARGGGGVPRTSSLAAPTMRLTGHVGEVFAAAFSSPSSDGGGGVLLASAGFDRSVLLWRASGECDNVAALQGHKNAVLSLAWLGGGGYGATGDAVLLSASADGTARAWSVERETQIKRAAEHGKSIVNCVAAATGQGAPPIFVTAGDDGVAVSEKFCPSWKSGSFWAKESKRESARERGRRRNFKTTPLTLFSPLLFASKINSPQRVWDMRVRRSVARLGEIEEEEEEEKEEEDEEDDDGDDEGQERRRQRQRRQQRRRRRRQAAGGFPMLACAVNPAADVAYTGGVDNVVRAW
jgi:WD40 repeat protein